METTARPASKKAANVAAIIAAKAIAAKAAKPTATKMTKAKIIIVARTIVARKAAARPRGRGRSSARSRAPLCYSNVAGLRQGATLPLRNGYKPRSAAGFCRSGLLRKGALALPTVAP